MKIEPHRNLDYADFPDLKKIIGSAWRKLTPITQGLDKAQVLSHLQGLESIRNDLAHSRSISDGSLSMVAAAYHVASPLFSTSPSPPPLPPTPIAKIALDRLTHAVEYGLKISPDDMSSANLQPDAQRKVADYERVRQRPGRELQLLEDVRREALDAIS